VSLPVAKRVRYLVRKLRDIIAQGGGSSQNTEAEIISVSKTERKMNVSVSAAARTSKQLRNDFVRELLRSEEFLSADDDTAVNTQLLSDSCTAPPTPPPPTPVSSSKTAGRKKLPRLKKVKLSDLQIDLTDAAVSQADKN